MHQWPAEIYWLSGAPKEHLLGLCDRLHAAHAAIPRKLRPFGSSLPIIKSYNINNLRWLGNQDSYLNDLSCNPLKYRYNLRCRSFRDRKVSRTLDIPQGNNHRRLIEPLSYRSLISRSISNRNRDLCLTMLIGTCYGRSFGTSWQADVSDL